MAEIFIYMSIEAYEELTSRFELYSQPKEGMDDIASGNTRPFSEAMVINHSSDVRRKVQTPSLCPRSSETA